jgi:hypothetical protein
MKTLEIGPSPEGRLVDVVWKGCRCSGRPVFYEKGGTPVLMIVVKDPEGAVEKTYYIRVSSRTLKLRLQDRTRMGTPDFPKESSGPAVI